MLSDHLVTNNVVQRKTSDGNRSDVVQRQNDECRQCDRAGWYTQEEICGTVSSSSLSSSSGRESHQEKNDQETDASFTDDNNGKPYRTKRYGYRRNKRKILKKRNGTKLKWRNRSVWLSHENSSTDEYIPREIDLDKGLEVGTENCDIEEENEETFFGGIMEKNNLNESDVCNQTGEKNEEYYDQADYDDVSVRAAKDARIDELKMVYRLSQLRQRKNQTLNRI